MKACPMPCFIPPWGWSPDWPPCAGIGCAHAKPTWCVTRIRELPTGDASAHPCWQRGTQEPAGYIYSCFQEREYEDESCFAAVVLRLCRTRGGTRKAGH